MARCSRPTSSTSHASSGTNSSSLYSNANAVKRRLHASSIMVWASSSHLYIPRWKTLILHATMSRPCGALPSTSKRAAHRHRSAEAGAHLYAAAAVIASGWCGGICLIFVTTFSTSSCDTFNQR